MKFTEDLKHSTVMSRSKTFEWCKRFKNGRTLVQDTPGRGGSEPTAVVSVNIQRVERLILENRRITCRQLVEQTHLSVGTLNTIIHEHLQFRKVSARWVPRQLSAFDRQRRVAGWELLPHPPYSPDLAQSDFHLFGPLKEFLGGHHFSSDEVQSSRQSNHGSGVLRNLSTLLVSKH